MWTYQKDVTRYMPLFEQPGELIFELNNVLNNQVNGAYDSMFNPLRVLRCLNLTVFAFS